MEKKNPTEISDDVYHIKKNYSCHLLLMVLLEVSNQYLHTDLYSALDSIRTFLAEVNMFG